MSLRLIPKLARRRRVINTVTARIRNPVRHDAKNHVCDGCLASRITVVAVTVLAAIQAMKAVMKVIVIPIIIIEAMMETID